MANDKFFLAKKTSATLTSAQVDTLKDVAINGGSTVKGAAVDNPAAATAAVGDSDNTEILADVADITGPWPWLGLHTIQRLPVNQETWC